MLPSPRLLLGSNRVDAAPQAPGHPDATVTPLDPESRRLAAASCAEPARTRTPPMRRAPRAPAARRPLRGLAPAAEPAAPARRRLRRHRAPGRGRRARLRPRAARRLPRRQPLHHVGLQVRAARGGREAPQARLAGPRAPARAGGLGAAARAPAPTPGEEAEQNELLAAVREGIADGPDTAPAAGARRPRR